MECRGRGAQVLQHRTIGTGCDGQFLRGVPRWAVLCHLCGVRFFYGVQDMAWLLLSGLFASSSYFCQLSAGNDLVRRFYLFRVAVSKIPPSVILCCPWKRGAFKQVNIGFWAHGVLASGA